jgi:short-subunit dehydrogenase
VVVDTAGVMTLVNNAGIGYHGLVEDMPFEKVLSLLGLNASKAVDLTGVLPQMLSVSGHIVNVGSAAGFVGVPAEAVLRDEVGGRDSTTA